MQVRERLISNHNKKGHYRYDSINEVGRDSTGSGLHSIRLGKHWFDFLYENNNAGVTLVTFSAAVPLERPYPVFSGWSFPKYLPVNLLAFADPAIASSPAIKTSWHLGNNDIHGPNLARSIIDIFSPENETTLFFGASAGGYAALLHSYERPHSAAFVMNPRIDLKASPDIFIEAAIDDTSIPLNAKVLARGPEDLKSLYAHEPMNHVFHLQNLGDAWYLKEQYGPFRNLMSENPNYHRIVKHWGRGHVAPPRKDYISLLSSLIESTPYWSIN
ncbi:hypothetical protein [Glutamicibacter sp. 2E12]|uniref:hypothetical protein n=1 Tax=Glutamicibacter sp. 2E12 TaxID=3416181 RepID=UPI003CED02B9